MKNVFLIGLFLAVFNGYLHVPNRGTENIKRVLFARDRSSVELSSASLAE